MNSLTATTAVVVSASPTPGSRAAILAGCAFAALSESGAMVRRVELSRISPAALYEGLQSDKLHAATNAVRNSDVVVVVAPSEGAAFSGLLPAFLEALPAETLRGKTIVPLLLGGDPASLARFEARLRRRFESVGAVVSLGELFDSADDFTAFDTTAALVGRVDRAVTEALPVPEPLSLVQCIESESKPALIAC